MTTFGPPQNTQCSGLEFGKEMQFWEAHCLLQRLKSMFFEIFLNGDTPMEPVD